MPLGRALRSPVLLRSLPSKPSPSNPVPPVTALTLTGPASGIVNVASTAFTVGVSPIGGTIAGTVTVTPSATGGGTFSPTTLALTQAQPSGTFTYTPTTTGSKAISLSNNGGLSNPAAWAYTSNPVPASAITLSGPSSGWVGSASTNFTVGANGALTGTVTVTPSDAGAGGTFNPVSVGINSGAPTATFTYTPASQGAKSISVVNSAGLANPNALTYTATPVPTTATISPTGTTNGITTGWYTYTVTLNYAAHVQFTVTPTPVAGVQYSVASVNIPIGQTTATFQAKRTSNGSAAIAFTTSPALTYAGSATLTTVAPTATLTGPAGGVGATGQPITYTITLNVDPDQTYIFTPAATNGASVSPSSVQIVAGTDRDATFTVTRATDGASSVSISQAGGLACTITPASLSLTTTGSTVAVGTLQHDGPATPEQISLFLPLTGTVSTSATATCRYRVQGASTWTPGHPLYRIRPSFSTTPIDGGAIQDGFAWPIIDVLPGTTYEVEVTVTDGAAVSTRTLTHTTRSLPAAAGAVTVNVAAGSTATQIATAINNAPAGAVIQLANGTYNLSGEIGITSGGSAGSVKYVRGASRTGVILARSTVGTFFSLDANLSDLVIENLTIQGNGVDQNGDVATSYTTVLGQSASDLNGPNLATRVTLRNVTATGIDRGVYMYRAEQMLVYDNTFTGNNLWQISPVNFLQSNRTWNDDGLNLSGNGNCGFNNFMKGFGDTFSCAQHVGGSGGYYGIGVHFYRNEVRNSCDDPFETDYARRNITFYDNRVHNSVNASSLDPLYGGPFLYARNTFVNTLRARLHKWNSTNCGQFFYNNTFVATTHNDPGIGSGPDFSNWYQPNNGDQRSYGYRNNVHVYRGAATTPLWIESTTHDPLDWTHNSWFPDRAIQFGGGSYANLATIQSGISNRTPIFSGTNRPFSNDNITTTNPWTTTVTFSGSDALTEVTATYSLALAGGSAPKNSGVVIPNITDNFSGAAPDRGAVIEGRPSVTYGDRSTTPAYIASMTDFQVRALTGTYAPTNGSSSIDSVTPSEWMTNDPAANDHSVIVAWCGAMKVQNGGTTKLFVHGGGHDDSANNGIYIFDYAGTSAPTGWVVRKLSAVSAVVPGGGNYTDGNPTSIHSYDGQVYASHNNCTYRFGGAYYAASSGKSQVARRYNIDSDSWTTLPACPIGMFGVCAYDPVSRKILVGDGSDSSEATNVYFFRCDTNTWSAAKPLGGSFYLGGDAVAAYDSLRSRVVVVGVVSGANQRKAITVDWENETVSTASFSINAVSAGAAFFYDALLDVFWSLGTGTSGNLTSITKINAGTGATVSTHSFVGTTSITVEAEHQGMFNRYSFFPEWRAVGTVASRATPAYIIKLPSA